MELIIGSYQDDDKNDVVFKWKVNFLSRPAKCFNCNQDIKVEQDLWTSVFGDNSVGVELKVEIWKLPPRVTTVEGFEKFSELLASYSVREGANSRQVFLNGLPQNPNRIVSLETRQRAQILHIVKRFASNLKSLRDFPQQIGKLQGNADAADVLKEFESLP